MTEQPNYTLNRIISAAKHEFMSKGYRDASLRDIAKDAHVTTGALYGYFKNKEDLFGALVHSSYYGFQQIYRDVLNEFMKLPPETQRETHNQLTIAYMRSLAHYMYDHHDAF